MEEIEAVRVGRDFSRASGVMVLHVLDAAVQLRRHSHGRVVRGGELMGQHSLAESCGTIRRSRRTLCRAKLLQRNSRALKPFTSCSASSMLRPISITPSSEAARSVATSMTLQPSRSGRIAKGSSTGTPHDLNAGG